MPPAFRLRLFPSIPASLLAAAPVADETLLATFTPDAPPAWTGTSGLPAPGSALTFKMFSLTPAGRYRSSKPLTLVRAG